MSEHDSQTALFQWAAYNEARFPELGLLFAVPNGTRTSPGVARKMVAEGVKKGVPDVCLPIARGKYIGLWIEMKSPGSYPRPEQKHWLQSLKKQGHFTAICHSWEEAAQQIEIYLQMDERNEL